MAKAYYKGYDDDRGRKPQRSLVMRLIDMAMTLLTIVVAVAIVFTYCVPYVNPSKVWFFPVLGLAAPGIYMATVILALYWVIRWRPVRAAVMILLVVAGFFKVSLFYKPEFRRNYGVENQDRRALTVMSYNVRSFFGEDGNSNVGDVMRLVEQYDPDIICLQEFNARLADVSQEFAQLRERYGITAFGRNQPPDTTYGTSVPILSKYRILGFGSLLTYNTSVWADLLVGDDTVRVFNNHLRSTAIKEDDAEYITNRDFLSDTARDDKLRSIVSRFRDNSVLRAAQVDTISHFVASSPGQRIICGDFNDTPMSYVYRVMAEGMNDAFRAKGSGYSHTFRGFFNMLRIDYILSSSDYEVLSYEVPEVDYSDHLPVVIRLKKTVKN
ncbi:endonuclease/exonuclease/phosphatase family protein [uncultured Alistipes sp.]|jgi:metal-dependent hydrolase|uniref:endonuclease/exonuclease/phosphatase family protein n=1 Tax=uncultured Alistipes sp. TaxID=538949 RepID=UPI0025E7090B|nr:endonuclease/exonuclease/phosphatase family protein [uncultured Alistipes sp.]